MTQTHTWDIVKEWDPRVTELVEVDMEALELSDDYMRLSGTSEIAGGFKKISKQLGMWPQKAILGDRKESLR